MPYSRPGAGVYVTNGSGGTIKHGQPFTRDGFAGVAVKQKANSWKDGISTQALIADGEKFFLITKGIVQVPTVSGFAVGDDVWIIAAENKLTETEGSNVRFGRVVEVAGERGTPTGMVRIDLDLKDGF